MLQDLWNKPGEPQREVQTSREKSVREPSPPRVETPASPRVARRITAPYTRVVTHKTPSPTVPYASTTRYRAQEKIISMIPQE